MWKILVFTVCISGGLAQLDLIFEWKELDYKFSSAAIREMMIKDGIFMPKNNVPARMEVYRNRLFVTIPRRREGVPVSLAFVDLADRTTKSPKFIPYPTWGAHYRDFYNEPQIADAENIAVDRCDRFWVLDNGTNPTLIAYDLKTDKILRRFTVPADQVYAYLNVMAVEDADCENTYAYIVDKYESNQMVVYSWAKNDSWLIILDKNIESLAMAPNNTLYITTKWTYELFSISTEYFRNESIAQQSMNAFTFLGSLGSETRLGTMVFDSQTGVLFYLAGNGSNVEHGQYELACWNTIKKHNVTASGSITAKDHTMFPLNDIKIDNQNLWVLSLRVPWSWKNQTDVNFRLFSASVLEAINNTFCDIPNSTINSTITTTTIAQKSSDT